MKTTKTAAIVIFHQALEEISIRSKELMNSGKLLEGYITDLLGSVIVEESMSLIHTKLTTGIEVRGFMYRLADN